MKKMKLLITMSICMISAIFGITLNAEEVTRTEMNEIKRNSSYFWKEATMVNSDEARESACLQLVNHINNLLNEEGKKVTPGQLSEIKYMTMVRGTNTCVLAYIPKATFGIKVADSQAPVIVTQSTAVQSTASQSTAAQSTAAQQQPVQKQSPSAVSNKNAETKSEQTYTACRSDGTIASTDNAIAAELFECENLQKAIQRLTVMKQTRRISDFGTPQNCANAAGAYWLVCNSNQEVVTVLSPGANDKRKNLKTGQDQGLADFPGMYAVWFTTAK